MNMTHREKRMKEITNIAWKLFLKQGYGETTMSDIAKASDISRKTLYQYFKSKEDIALEIEIGVFEDFTDIMKNATAHMEGSGFGRLSEYLDIIDSNLDKYCDALQFTGIFDFKIKEKYHITPQVHRLIKLIQGSDDYLKKIIQVGIEDGSIKNTIEPEIAAETINDSWLYLAQKVFSRQGNIDRAKKVDSRQMISYQMMLFKEALKR